LTRLIREARKNPNVEAIEEACRIRIHKKAGRDEIDAKKATKGTKRKRIVDDSSSESDADEWD